AEETIVLMKNDGILPLSASEEIAFIGKFAAQPRYQGGGSSHINSHKVDSAVDAVKGMNHITYAQGFNLENEEVDAVLMSEAIEAAKKAKVAVIFAGLPDAFESEGYDRSHMRLPECQNVLIEKILTVQPNVIVVLHNGSPVEMPWVKNVRGIVEAYLGGQAVGSALTDILFGKVNPSAKLPETFPLKLEDNPSFLSYLGEGDKVEYKEGVFVGYRYYDTKKMDVLFPFGHGLSYTTFEYSNLKVSNDQIKDTDTMTVSVDVKNTGSMAGKEVVQVYVADKLSTVIRPVKELREFAKVDLAPGETKTVTFTLGKRPFAYWNVAIHDWHVESGEFEIMIGKSSRDIVLSQTVTITSTVKLPLIYTMDTTIGDIMENPEAAETLQDLTKVFAEVFGGNAVEPSESAVSSEMMNAMMKFMPLRGSISFGMGKVTWETLQGLLDKLNGK
ncbi:MAG: glycoside hydrolase family 3 C-terminal domain-containing protein, partial [Mobilitalea sp.]